MTTFRDLTTVKVFYTVDEFPALKAFVGKLEARDREVLVLVRDAGATVAAQ